MQTLCKPDQTIYLYWVNRIWTLLSEEEKTFNYWFFNLSDLVWLSEKPCGEYIVISDIIWLSFSNQKKSLCSFRSVKSGICKIRRMVHAESNGVLRNESKQLPKTFKWAGCLFHITLDLSSLLTISFYRRYTFWFSG